MPKLSQLLPEVLSIARLAGARIMEIYVQDFEVDYKGDDSPLTSADLASHKVITEKLQALTPDIPCLSEEGASIPFAERRQWQTYWLIDPLDGTREFVKKNGEFTVNIALITNGEPILGVVSAPALDTDYYAARGIGAFRSEKQQEAERISVSACHQPPRLLVSRSHRSAEIDDLLQRIGPHEAVSRGSSLKFCMVACGNADLYPRLGLTSEWDTAAGQAVVEAAGGSVSLADAAQRFAPLRYNTKDSLLNPHFLVIGDQSHDWTTYFS